MSKDSDKIMKRIAVSQIKRSMPVFVAKIATKNIGEQFLWRLEGDIAPSTVKALALRIRRMGHTVEESPDGLVITKNDANDWLFKDAISWMDEHLKYDEPFHWIPESDVSQSEIDTIVDTAQKFGYIVAAMDGYLFTPPSVPGAVQVVNALHNMEQYLKTNESFNWVPDENVNDEIIMIVVETAKKAGFVVDTTNGYVFTNPHNVQANW